MTAAECTNNKLKCACGTMGAEHESSSSVGNIWIVHELGLVSVGPGSLLIASYRGVIPRPTVDVRASYWLCVIGINTGLYVTSAARQSWVFKRGSICRG